MASIREKYLQWRNKALPASKHNIIDVHRRMSDEISKLDSRLDTLCNILADIRRSQIEKAERDAWIEFSALPSSHEESKPELVSHSNWMPHLSAKFNRPGIRILEIGSRNVTGGATRIPFSAAHYIGFDCYDGENVDVVGDAHKLSSYFRDEEKFDLILSSAVFEHFHMPWVVAHEIQKLLKVGGYVFVETHFSFSFHEKPWNFFQFSNMGLRALFNTALGFDLIDSGMSNPMNGVFSQEADEYLRGKPVGELYCHSEILCRKSRDVSEFDWSQVGIDVVGDNTRYPSPTRITA